MKTTVTKLKPKGLGDTVKKVADAIGANHIADAYEKVTGKPCNCDKRQDTLNRVFPYSK